MSDNNDIISIANEIATQKENIRKAIVAQGVTCPESTPLNQYPGKIANINGVTTVPNTIWHDNNITSATTTYTVPAGVGIVGGRIFDDNRAVLESVDFNSAIAVTENTCCDCTSLTNVTGINAKYIGENAFHNCYNLTSLESNSLEYVADKFNLSRSYLSKKFKTATGFGFKEYIINVRIQNACNLLLETNKSITDIAFECGFNDSNYFGDAFRKAKGISPHKYRKNETF